MPGLYKLAPGWCVDTRIQPSSKPSTVQVLPGPRAGSPASRRVRARVSVKITFSAECERPHITALHLVVSPRTIEWCNYFREFAVTSRKPTFVRWAEEAEAKQVCEWAGLEGAFDRSDTDPERSRGSGERLSFLRRLCSLFGSQVAEIERDG
jgi:hypothetical protein